jgi:hydrogenase maturation protein HypF
LTGVRDTISYEGEAAIELEKIAAAASDDLYGFNIQRAREKIVVEFWPMIKEIAADLRKKRPLPLVSRKFHNTLAEAIKETSSMIRKKTKLNNVVLSGGVFQNKILLREAKKRLEKAKFSVYTHVKTSCADRSLSLGQAVIAAYKMGAKRCV